MYSDLGTLCCSRYIVLDTMLYYFIAVYKLLIVTYLISLRISLQLSLAGETAYTCIYM